MIAQNSRYGLIRNLLNLTYPKKKKKCTQFSFICYASNMVNVNHNTWWIDFGSTIHVSNTLQGMQNLRKPVGSKQYIYSSSKMSFHVEVISTYGLVLSSGFIFGIGKGILCSKFF